ncbi:MAG: hypothetical protein IM638_10560 [Bacteroidetes bacterium]|nr:hypothetical protein [Bacteroidota bacterium]
MAGWTFFDDYGTQYPALINSNLSFLFFSEHTISGNTFTGVLDAASSGLATSTLAWLSGMNSWNITGTITTTNNVLVINLQLAESDQAAFTSGMASNIPLIGGDVTQSATLQLSTNVPAALSNEEDPLEDEFNFQMVLAVGSSLLTITSPVPVNGGFFTITGTFTNAGINLSDLSFLFGGSSGDYTWFPSSELGPYYSNTTQLGLLQMDITVFTDLNKKAINISDATVSIGISNLPIYEDRIYLNPLAVWISMSNPQYPTNATVTWGLQGSVVVCNYERTGDPNNPDFSLDCDMNLVDFSLTAALDNRQNVTVNTMIQDVLGQGTSFGLSDTLTVDKLEFQTKASTTTGLISNFGFEVAMSGGFGLFENFDIESFDLTFAYTSNP